MADFRKKIGNHIGEEKLKELAEKFVTYFSGTFQCNVGHQVMRYAVMQNSPPSLPSRRFRGQEFETSVYLFRLHGRGVLISEIMMRDDTE